MTSLKPIPFLRPGKYVIARDGGVFRESTRSLRGRVRSCHEKIEPVAYALATHLARSKLHMPELLYRDRHGATHVHIFRHQADALMKPNAEVGHLILEGCDYVGHRIPLVGSEANGWHCLKDDVGTSYLFHAPSVADRIFA
jgi:hypothetical protein